MAQYVKIESYWINPDQVVAVKDTTNEYGVYHKSKIYLNGQLKWIATKLKPEQVIEQLETGSIQRSESVKW